MFKTRLLSGIVLVLVAFLTINCGGYVLLATLLCVSLIGMQELYRAMHVRKEGFGALGLVSYAGVLLIHLLLIPGDSAYPLMGVIASLVLIMCVYVFCYPAYQAGQIMAAFFGIVYVGVMLSYIYQTRMLPGGQFHVWLIFLCSWGCDTCAYCVGVLIGKHKMAPRLSPKKSVEGGVGGVLGAALLGALFSLAMNQWGGADVDPLLYAVNCGGGGIISQIGGLAASAIKRNHDVKDYGKLIPGHGGILDRFDSVIFTAPVIYYLAAMIR